LQYSLRTVTPFPVGERAPDFAFQDESTRRSLAELRGTPVIVTFAAAEPHRRQPMLQYVTIEGERLVVVAPDTASVADRYGVRGLAAVFVVSSRGEIVWRFVRREAAAESIEPSSPSGLSRRDFIAAVFAASIAATLAGNILEAASTSETAAAPGSAADIAFVVNGRQARLSLDPRVTLLDALRERMDLPGTKKGCDQGQCGACTVLLGGRRVKSCLTLAIMCEGSPVVTIEGLARGPGGEELHPLQAAFIAEDAFQCGYCTSGQLMSAAGLLAEGHAHTDDEVRAEMSGNICRCGAYPNIVAAIQRARKEV
jgi:xanthine dehydrogenase YagT iron-sulfur-binding subunit